MKTTGFVGTWHIREMEAWDKDYFNMEVRAYITVERGARGEFQFGLVHGNIDGRVVNSPDGKRFEFTWEGNDECDEASGDGWMKLRPGGTTAEGEIRFHCGDTHKFRAIMMATNRGKAKKRRDASRKANKK